MRSQILGKDDLPSLNETIAIILAEEGQRSVMMEPPQVESSALISKPVTNRAVDKQGDS